MRLPSSLSFGLAAVLLAQLSGAAPAQPAKTTAPTPISVETVATGLRYPWGIAFLPDGRALVSEREGRLRIVNLRTNQASGPIAGVPEVVAEGQGGLLGLALDPDFPRNAMLYLCFSERRESGTGTSVARARLAANHVTLEDVTIIFRQMPAVASGRHFGCRIVPDGAGNLFVTLGDRGSESTKAQKLDTHIGKIVRIRPDGTAPPDNPFTGRADALPEIWSYGHRNIQGAARDPATGALFTAEHGARGGDEINRPEAGKNYGWPVITYGRDYSGAKIGIGTSAPGLEQPLYYWDPSIAPSGAAFYVGDKFPTWRGSLLVGALAGQLIARLTVANGRITGEERLLTDLGERIRDIAIGPDGFVYALTDARNGALIRLAPK